MGDYLGLSVWSPRAIMHSLVREAVGGELTVRRGGGMRGQRLDRAGLEGWSDS